MYFPNIVFWSLWLLIFGIYILKPNNMWKKLSMLWLFTPCSLKPTKQLWIQRYQRLISNKIAGGKHVCAYQWDRLSKNSSLSFWESRRKAYMVATVVAHGHVWLWSLYRCTATRIITDNWLLFSTCTPLSFAQAHSINHITTDCVD